jgi:hypothetical protein
MQDVSIRIAGVEGNGVSGNWVTVKGITANQRVVESQLPRPIGAWLTFWKTNTNSPRLRLLSSTLAQAAADFPSPTALHV